MNVKGYLWAAAADAKRGHLVAQASRLPSEAAKTAALQQRHARLPYLAECAKPIE